MQPCVSPVWDTAIATIALADAALPAEHAAWGRAVDWLLARELRQPGDWAINGPRVEPTGWHFQFHNKFYPDLDDSAMVVLALNRSPMADHPAVAAATRRAVDWLLSMQNRDGGWAAYDVDIDNQVLTKLPFADHNAMLDPSCADITARVLELLGTLGYGPDHPAVRAWPGLPVEHAGARGLLVRPVGGQLHLRHLASAPGPGDTRAADGPASADPGGRVAGIGPAARRAPGARPAGSYEDPSLKGTGEPTPSQTAWATLGLIAAGRARTPAVRRGIEYLVRAQNADGSWDEATYTGTGFPRVFYLRYHYYRIYFPLMALSRYRAAMEGETTQSTPALASRIPAEPVSREP